MKTKTTLRLGAALLALASVTLAAVHDADDSTRRAASEATFERFKSMAGAWNMDGEHTEIMKDGELVEEIATRFRTTAGGSAVLELLFEGTDHEMVSVYHMSGDDLVLTHYCVVGNAPHMVMKPTDDPDIVDFICKGGANVDCATSQHMHSARYEFREDGSVHTHWEMIAGGEAVHSATFDLTKK